MPNIRIGNIPKQTLLTPNILILPIKYVIRQLYARYTFNKLSALGRYYSIKKDNIYSEIERDLGVNSIDDGIY